MIYPTYEYGIWYELKDYSYREKLQTFLDDIWQKRAFAFAKEWITDDEEHTSKSQPFLQFDGKKFRAQNFVGFIQMGDLRIDIYPKVFNGHNCDIHKMTQHLFYWLSYCSKIRFPFLKSDLDVQNIDSLPELLIYLIVYEIKEQVSTSLISMYEPQSEILITPRGRIDIKNYIKNGLSSGNWQNIDCEYEPFTYDNTVNQVIKYVCRLLQNVTKVDANRLLLDEIIFILDDVEDCVCTTNDVDSIKLNPIFSGYTDIIQWCRMILEQQTYSGDHCDSAQWCFLLPMEYVFEDFITGFLKKHYSDKWKVRPQAEIYLSTEPMAFKMKHDILLEHKERKIIIDTKYKLRTKMDINDVKQGVAQSDMYQMVSYGLRRRCSDIYLLYPSKLEEAIEQEIHFKIPIDSADFSDINIKVVDIPFWSEKGWECLSNSLDDIFRFLKRKN